MGNRFNSDQITRDYFDSLVLEMRHIDGVLPDTTFELYGETFDTPIMMAALSHLNSVHEDGIVEMSRGACLANAVNWVGMGDKEELERVTATGAKTIKIIKPYADNDMIFDRMEHAEKCGVMAMGMDVDHAFDSDGNYDVVHGLRMQPKSIDEIREFVKATSLPFIVKGVLSASDAYKCAEAGVKGIVVSHHHGIMNYAVPPLQILPDIVKAVDGKTKIFVDCGVESGMDVYKALALGADAVCVGRAVMKPLEEGAEGVRKKLAEMTTELATVMARTGVKKLSEIDSSVIWQRTM